MKKTIVELTSIAAALFVLAIIPYVFKNSWLFFFSFPFALITYIKISDGFDE